MYDVIIVGAGVIGCAIARELSRYDVDVCVLEKEEDVCCGTSKANSAIVHAGYDAMPGTLMAKLNVEGNERMEELSKELDFPFTRNGSLVVCMDENDYDHLEELYRRGITNGVKGLKIITREEALQLEPNLSKQIYAALYAPTAGIVCPFAMTIALAENSFVNGVEYYFDTLVERIITQDECYLIKTNRGDYVAKCVINAAGVYADRIHNEVTSEVMKLIPRKGEYCLLDHDAGDFVTRTIFSMPGKLGKGVLIAPTVHGNLLMGPTAADLDDKEDTSTTEKGLAEIITKAKFILSDIPTRQIITSFAGLRAHEVNHDFIIQKVTGLKGFYDVAGIESPGLASAPAIGVMVSEMVREDLCLSPKNNFIKERKGVINVKQLSFDERKELIQCNPAYGTIICRCEEISEGEIIDAIQRPLGAKSLDGVKRRVRAGMGRCQGGFCSPKVMELLTKVRNQSMTDVTKSGKDSKVVYSNNKSDRRA